MLTKEDFKRAADKIGVEPEIIEAVTEVESPRGAFDEKGKLSILFEAHVFYRELVKKGINPKNYLPANKDILSSTWNPSLYGKYSAQWGRLEKAAKIDRDSAYKSASYGAFQIMGNNAESLGYKSVHDFVVNQEKGEVSQLNDFIKFIQVNGLVDELKSKDWAAFAKGYNGPGYAQNKYDQKLEAAYNKLKKK